MGCTKSREINDDNHSSCEKQMLLKKKSVNDHSTHEKQMLLQKENVDGKQEYIAAMANALHWLEMRNMQEKHATTDIRQGWQRESLGFIWQLQKESVENSEYEVAKWPAVPHLTQVPALTLAVRFFLVNECKEGLKPFGITPNLLFVKHPEKKQAEGPTQAQQGPDHGCTSKTTAHSSCSCGRPVKLSAKSNNNATDASGGDTNSENHHSKLRRVEVDGGIGHPASLEARSIREYIDDRDKVVEC